MFPVGRACLRPPTGENETGIMGLPKRKHLRRLDRIFHRGRAPIFYLTCCVHRRAPLLATDPVVAILRQAWRDASDVHGWLIGRYVVMPDHVHFFAAPRGDHAKELGSFFGSWKQWTGRRIREHVLPRFRWQREFFDHLLRGAESYEQKWEYVRANPVRARLVSNPDEWPYQGEVHLLEW